jgi:SGNH domain (fused to AT3 domains)
VSENTSARVSVPRGQDMFEAKVVGYMSAWRALPPSVKHIVVIRDPPHNVGSTRSCVERAQRQRRRPGPACARPRDRSLEPDPAMVAAARAAARRVRTIDLTRFMCDSEQCYPVVGGVLVHKDRGHLTRSFSTTLGPFLLRRVNALIAHWR